ncbi:MAG: hypothetical protein ACREHV_07945 [Rhizomicrobium sp.]
MPLATAIEVVTNLAKRGVVERYAIAGAVAALNYIQPTLTEDLDILVSINSFQAHRSELLPLAPIESALAEMGYCKQTGAGVLVEDWPVQFLPVASALDEEALEQAVEVEIGNAGTPVLMARCLRAEHVVATALKLGRLKDWARIEAFLEQDAVDLQALRNVLDRHRLMAAWRTFCLKAGKKDTLE